MRCVYDIYYTYDVKIAEKKEERKHKIRKKIPHTTRHSTFNIDRISALRVKECEPNNISHLLSRVSFD